MISLKVCKAVDWRYAICTSNEIVLMFTIQAVNECIKLPITANKFISNKNKRKKKSGHQHYHGGD